MDDVIKLNIAFKTLQLLGQVVRDSPASLKADLKLDAIRSVYLLGLRVLRAVLLIAEDNVDEFRRLLAEVLSGHKRFDTPVELAQATDRALTNLTRACAFGMIKKISYAVGLQELEQTYRTLLQEYQGMSSVHLVDLSIRLDHFAEYPEAKVIKLAGDLRKNFLGTRLLRDLVVNHMRLVEVDRRIRARLGELLNINASHPSVVTAPKRLAAAADGDDLDET